MKKLIYTLSCVLCVGVLTTTAYAQDEETDDEVEESIVNFTPESEEIEWLLELMNGATPFEDDIEDVLAEAEDVSTYLAFSSFYSGQVAEGDTPVDESLVTTTFTQSLVHEDGSQLEVERYRTDSERNILAPQSYMNSINNEMYLYDTVSGSFIDYTTSGFTVDDIMIERYDNIYENLASNIDAFDIYENVEYLIFVSEALPELENQFLTQSGWSLDSLVEDSFEYSYIVLINKETSRIDYNGLVTDAVNNVDEQSYRTEYYTYYYDHDMYENLDEMYDENAFEYEEEEEAEDTEETESEE